MAVAAAAFGLALLLARFGQLGLAPFVHDEANLLLTAWRQIETGQLADHSPLAGTAPFLYGPTPLWFFAIVQGLIGKHALSVIAANAAIICLCQLALIYMLHLRGSPPLRPSYWALAGVLIVAASSPYQFYWSRLATDMIPNVAPFVALAIFALDDFGPLHGALLGLVLGLSISAHPMVAPFALACLGVILIARIGPASRRMLTFLSAGAMLLVANLPWLRYLRHAELTLPVQQDLGWPVPFEPFLAIARPHSVSGLSYIFDDDWQIFSAAHPWLTMPEVQQASLALAAFVTLIGLLALAIQRREPGLRRIAWVGLACACAYPLLELRLQLDGHPHRQLPVVWLTVAGAAGIFYARSRWLFPLRLLALVLAGVNIAFIAAWGDFIHERVGTRGVHYGTPVAEQTRFMQAACEAPGRTIHIENATALASQTFQHHFKSEPKCRGRKLDLCGDEGCQSVPPKEAIVRLGYRDLEGGALTWSVEPQL